MPRPVDATLIAEMFDRHAAALALYARQWTAQADDCVQEALIELARQPQAPDNPAAWLYRVVRNRALNAARAQRRRTAHEQGAHAPHERRMQPDPAERSDMVDALDRLPVDVREVVVLRVWGQLAWQEIAEVVGGSRSGAQRTYVAGLEQLRGIWDVRSRDDQPCRTK
jgi:RNA polymerase sigma-70 factor (ECF subfamily)